MEANGGGVGGSGSEPTGKDMASAFASGSVSSANPSNPVSLIKKISLPIPKEKSIKVKLSTVKGKEKDKDKDKENKKDKGKGKVPAVGSASTTSGAQGGPKIRIKGIAKKEEDEVVPLEEHFILRVPPGDIATKVKEIVKARQEISESQLSIKFSDQRHAVFNFEGNRYSAKLVDLPCIIESQKTMDYKLFHKIADISQMIVVEPQPLHPDEAMPPPPKPHSHRKKGNDDSYVWPHGMTAPMKYVRKRRFRKRISKRAIEDVEREVQRLLEADAEAEDVRIELHEQREPEPPSTFLAGGPGDEEAEAGAVDEDVGMGMDGMGGVDMGQTPDYGGLIGDSEEAGAREGVGSGSGAMAATPADEGGVDDFDFDLAAEIEEALDADGVREEGEGDGDGDGEVDESEAEDEEDEEEEEEEEEDDEESADEDEDDGDQEDGDLDGDAEERNQLKQQYELLVEEVADLEAKIEEKTVQVQSQVNIIMKRRFEDIVRKLKGELDIKKDQLKGIKEELGDL
ncbi:hypothetical protein HK102_001056 [Quaeritorhiza haematococci]|nr:hypothetical protein HK102_001056 [Quaeritorhiza haematococci]